MPYKDPEKRRECQKRYRKKHIEKEKKWREEHPDKVKAYREKWRIMHPEKDKECKKNWCENHSQKRKEVVTKYCKEHREEIRERKRKQYKEYPEKAREYSRKYYEKHLEQERKRKREWSKENSEKRREYRKKIRSTAKGKIEHRISNAIWQSLKKNKAGRHWELLVGYTLDQLMRHLEHLFTSGMGWRNMGLWHIDHKFPKSKFYYSSPEDPGFKKCWSLENLQPLWGQDNIAKGNKV